MRGSKKRKNSVAEHVCISMDRPGAAWRYDTEKGECRLQTVINWINVKDELPNDQEEVAVVYGYRIEYVKFLKGISKAEREQMKHGEIDNPIVGLWGPVSGYVESKRSESYRAADEDGNNKKPYCWYVSSAGANINGQEITWWAKIPHLPENEKSQAVKSEMNINN